MNRLSILACILLTLLTITNSWCQQSDLQKENLKGPIVKVTTDTYDATQKFGENVKGELQSSSTSIFDFYGNLRKTDNNESIITYVYDKNHKIIKIIQTHPKHFIKEDYKYNNAGKLIERNIYKGTDTLEYKWKYEYSKNEIISYKYSSDGSLSSKEVKNLQKNYVEEDKSILGIPASSTKTQYDAFGRKILEKAIILDIITGEARYRYNSNNDIISQSFIITNDTDNANARTVIALLNSLLGDFNEQYTYEYDRFNNWTVKKVFSNGSIKSWTERKIIYAKSKEHFNSIIAQEERKLFIEDSLAKRKQFVKDSLKNIEIQQELRKRELEERVKFIRDSIKNHKALFIKELSTLSGKIARDFTYGNSLNHKNDKIVKVSYENGYFLFTSKKSQKQYQTNFAYELEIDIPYNYNCDATAYISENEKSIIFIFRHANEKSDIALAQYCDTIKDYLIFELSAQSKKTFDKYIGATSLDYYRNINKAYQKATENINLESIDYAEETIEEAIPFQLVEEKPSFMGGDANAFSKWVNERLIYPKDAKKNGIQGRVTLQFTVDTDGTVSEVKVLRGVNPSLDQEAVRVVSLSPKWIPGKQRGKPVKVTYTFPVIF